MAHKTQPFHDLKPNSTTKIFVNFLPIQLYNKPFKIEIKIRLKLNVTIRLNQKKKLVN
jgi:hypothetical protein